MKYYIKTFGCQMNVSDSQMVEELLEERGFAVTKEVREADLIMINTCSVREKAEVKAEGQIREYSAIKKPGALLWVVGCMAERVGEELMGRIKGITRVIGAPDMEYIPEMIDAFLEPLGTFARQQVDHGESEWSAFIPIMRGCDNYCTYCIVPHVRGREHSIPVADIVTAVEKKVAAGVLEVTLLGQNVNSYMDEKTDFTALLRAVHEVDGLKRIRFTTSHPKDISDSLIAAIAELPKLCNHIHLPVQSGSSAVLKRMNRSYTREEYLERIDKIRATIPAVDLTTDVMVGFPGETLEQYEETLSLFDAIQYTSAFMFAYSERSGTPAARFKEQVLDADKKAWLNRLITQQTDVTKAAYAAMVGSEVEVYCTYKQEKGGGWVGQDYGSKRVLVKSSEDLGGTLVRGVVTKSTGMTLVLEEYQKL